MEKDIVTSSVRKRTRQSRERFRRFQSFFRKDAAMADGGRGQRQIFEQAGKYPDQPSGGQQQLVAIEQTLCMSRKLLVEESASALVAPAKGPFLERE
jgi:ABC-type glutathione transport system ATPase component